MTEDSLGKRALKAKRHKLEKALSKVKSTRPELQDGLQSFRQGWKEAMAGDTMPIDDLWKGIGNDW